MSFDLIHLFKCFSMSLLHKCSEWKVSAQLQDVLCYSQNDLMFILRVKINVAVKTFIKPIILFLI